MKKIIVCGVLLALSGAIPAAAQQCRSNFNIRGEVYTTSQVVRNVTPAAAFPRLVAVLRSKGYHVTRVNEAAKTVSALQETSGSGRPQSMTVSAGSAPQGTRVSIRFVVQPGQLAPAEPAIQEFCSIIDAAR